MKRIIMLLLVTCQLMLVAVANDGSSLWLPREHNAQPSTFVKGSKGMALEELRNYYRGEVTVRLKLNRKARSGDAYSIQVTPERITLSSGTSSGLLYAAYDLLRMQQLGPKALPASAEPLGQPRWQRRAWLCRQEHLEMG